MTPEQSAMAFGYLTTRGRVTGRDHTVEIWFADHDGVAYVLAGDVAGSDWCRNIATDSRVSFAVAGSIVGRSARQVVEPTEDALARQVVFGKYQPGYGDDLTEWRDTATPFAIDLDPPPGVRPSG